MMKPSSARTWTVFCLLVFLTTPHGAPSGTGYFWQFTDFHCDKTYESDMLSCRGEVTDPGIYGDFNCDSPWVLVYDCIVSLANIKRNVDFIIWTGDSQAHVKQQYLSEADNLEMFARITDVFKREFPGVSVYATMGNRDWYPAQRHPGHSAYMYKATAELWKLWIGDDEQLENFRKGGFYTVPIHPGLRFVGVNTAQYYTMDGVTRDMTDPADQFVWLEKVLQQAKGVGEKVLLSGHIPPGIKVPGHSMWFRKQFNDRFLNIVQKYTDIITAMFFGHNHVDLFKLLLSSKGDPGTPMFMAPSVTPRNHRNPGGRLYEYNRATGVVLDYVQYYMNLTHSNKVKTSSWEQAYTASEAYDVGDLSGDSVHGIIKKMATHDEYLDKYIRFMSVLANDDATVEHCSDKCKADYICGFTEHRRQDLETCVKSEMEGPAH